MHLNWFEGDRRNRSRCCVFAALIAVLLAVEICFSDSLPRLNQRVPRAVFERRVLPRYYNGTPQLADIHVHLRRRL